MSNCPCGHTRYGYEIVGTELRKEADSSVHLLRQPPGWAIQKDVLDAHPGVKSITINDRRKRESFTASMATVLEHGVEIERGAGKQIVLPIERWTRVGRTHQIGLFEGEAVDPEAAESVKDAVLLASTPATSASVKYILFGSHPAETRGGGLDFRGGFAQMSRAMEAGDKLPTGWWVHIFDTDKMKVTLEKEGSKWRTR